MSPTRVIEIAVHPANGLELREHPMTCGDCSHYDAQGYRCLASRDAPTTAPSWPACTRYTRRGHLGSVLTHLRAHPMSLAGGFLGSIVSVIVVALR